MEKNGTSASPATARSVLPVPGAPKSRTPGDAAAERLELLGVLEELHDLLDLLDGLLDAGHVLEADLGESGVIRFARDLPKLITLEPPPWTWFIRKIQKPNSRTNGNREVRIVHHGEPPFES